MRFLISAILLLSLIFPSYALKDSDPFRAERRAWMKAVEDPGVDPVSQFQFAQDDQGDSNDELESAYDPYLDSVPLKTFPLRSFDELLDKLGEAFRGGKDPYAQEYVKKDPLTRFPMLKHRDDRYWLFDNYRATELVERKGEKLADGTIAKKNKVKIRWTSALVDLDKLEKVYWVMTTFNTLLGPVKIKTGHAQLYFQFADGGVQTPLGDFNSLVNSYEGFRDQGTIFNPIKGMLKSYESIFVMGSFEDVALKALMVFNGVDVYELKMTKEEKKRALIHSLALATDLEELKKRYYHTTRNSCVTNQVRIVNSAVAPEKRIDEWFRILGYRVFRTLGSILPGRIPGTLNKTGLLESEAHYIGRDKIRELYELTEKEGGYSHKSQLFEELYQD